MSNHSSGESTTSLSGSNVSSGGSRETIGLAVSRSRVSCGSRFAEGGGGASKDAVLPRGVKLVGGRSDGSVSREVELSCGSRLTDGTGGGGYVSTDTVLSCGSSNGGRSTATVVSSDSGGKGLEGNIGLSISTDAVLS